MLGCAVVFYAIFLPLFPQNLTQDEKHDLTSQELLFHL